jgi:hypothetical protein
MACAGDVPTLETLAAVSILREHLWIQNSAGNLSLRKRLRSIGRTRSFSRNATVSVIA